MRDVRPGELIVIDEDGVQATQAVPEGRHALCIFEHVYFAPPRLDPRRRRGAASRPDGPSRLRSRRPSTPTSCSDPRLGHARRGRLHARFRIPYSEGVDQEPVRRPHLHPARRRPAPAGGPDEVQPLAEVDGKRLVIVDDSIVRGSTMRPLVGMLFDAGAEEVHVRIVAADRGAVLHGIDMADEEQLAAAHRSVEQMRELIGATSLHYLSLEGMQAATRLPERRLSAAPASPAVPTRAPEERNLAKLRFEPGPIGASRLSRSG